MHSRRIRSDVIAARQKRPPVLRELGGISSSLFKQAPRALPLFKFYLFPLLYPDILCVVLHIYLLRYR